MPTGAVPVVSRLPQYEELVREGDLGLLFEPRDALTMAAQLERLVSEPELARLLTVEAHASHRSAEEIVRVLLSRIRVPRGG